MTHYVYAIKRNIAFLLCLVWLTACGTNDNYTNRADEKRYALAGVDDPNPVFNFHLDVYDYQNTSETPVWEDEHWTGATWHRIELKGTAASADKAWIDPSCGPQIAWEHMDADAHAHVRSLYENFPLGTQEDIDAVFEHVLDPSNADSTGIKKWQFDLNVPDHYLRTLFSNDKETTDIFAAIQDFHKQVETTKTVDAPYVFFSLNLPEEAIKAKELVAYLEDFSDAALRAYLEKNKPECLVK